MRARFASVVGSPVDPSGSLLIRGDFFHQEDGLLAVDLGGTSGGVDYDAISVTGSIELRGALAVCLSDVGGAPFAPALGNAFDVLSAAQGVFGQFSDLTLPVLSEELDWRVDYLPNVVKLTVISSADFNRDGAVDGVDLSLWRAGLGTVGDAEKSDGDANNDGAVDGADFLMWQRQLGVVIPNPPTTTVPEPVSMAMIAIAAAFAYSCRVRAAIR
jgi:hypothetical protein